MRFLTPQITSEVERLMSDDEARSWQAPQDRALATELGGLLISSNWAPVMLRPNGEVVDCLVDPPRVDRDVAGYLYAL